jgi:hypothetical protein
MSNNNPGGFLRAARDLFPILAITVIVGAFLVAAGITGMAKSQDELPGGLLIFALLVWFLVMLFTLWRTRKRRGRSE